MDIQSSPEPTTHPAVLLFVIIVLTVTPAPMAMAEDSLSIEHLSRPEDGGSRRLALQDQTATLFSEPSDASEVVTTLSQDVVLSNLGCAEVEDKVWCNVALMDGSRTGYVSAKHVAPAIGPDGRVAVGVDDSKRRARGRDFDGSDQIACAQNEGESLGRCKASIARSGGGDATVVVTFSNSFRRELYFTHGEFRRGNSTMSGVGTDTEWRLESGTYAIRVDDQRYEIPKDFVLGQ